MADQALRIAAGGRPFQLGMVYGARNDELVTGFKLWDSRYLHITSDVHPDGIYTRQDNSWANMEFDESESFSRRASLLDVNASLKLSVLCGLVSLSGSASYLNDKKRSSKEARISLIYTANTHFVELPVNDRTIQHQNVFNFDTATHVVTGIQYGGNAVFTFSVECSDESEVQKVTGNLKVAIYAIPGISIGGEGSVNVSNVDENFKRSIKCKYSGDFTLDETPITFEAAKEVIRELPGIVNKSAVPKIVYLTPLYSLDNRAMRIVRQISSETVNRVADYMDVLEKSKITVEELSEEVGIFSRLNNKLKKFSECLTTHKNRIQAFLCQILPGIRGGGAEEQILLEYINRIFNNSPFNREYMLRWIDDRKAEINALNKITRPCIADGIEINLDAHPDGNLLETMDTYLATGAFDNDIRISSWTSSELGINFANHTRNFIRFAKATLAEESSSTIGGSRFIVSTSEGINPHYKCNLYTEGKKEEISIQSKLGAPIFVESTLNSIKIQWTATPPLAIEKRLGYDVSWRKVNISSDNQPNEWSSKSKYGNDTNFVIENILSGTEYIFKVRIRTEFGVTEYSNESSAMRTATSTLDAPQNVKLADGFNLVRKHEGILNFSRAVRIRKELVHYETAMVANKKRISKMVSITFDKPFEKPPEVFWSVCHVDINCGRNTRYEVFLKDTKRDCCIFEVITWYDSIVYGIHVDCTIVPYMESDAE